MTTWDEFERNLAQVVGDARHRTFVVIQAQKGPGVAEFCVAPNLTGEITTSADVPIPPGAPEFDGLRARLHEWGFRSEPGLGHDLWVLKHPWPAPSRVLDSMARGMRYALAEGFGVSTPDGLEYRAWRYPQVWPRSTTLSDEQISALDPGDEFLEVSELGVRRDPTHRPATVDAPSNASQDASSSGRDSPGSSAQS